jgi:Fe2+ or Zn2+ uptake regulation protein
MGKKGHKSSRGIGELHDEIKSERQVIKLTPTAYNLLRFLASESGLSISELVEQLIRSSVNKSR